MPSARLGHEPQQALQKVHIDFVYILISARFGLQNDLYDGSKKKKGTESNYSSEVALDPNALFAPLGPVLIIYRSQAADAQRELFSFSERDQ